MNIKKINERMDERGLGFAGIMALKTLCESASEERIEYLISQFNSGSSSLEEHEICFLINYVTKRGEWGLYITDSGEKMILSAKEIETNGYTVVEDQISEENSVARIKEDLEKKGFKFLETQDFLLAFCEERNIVFYSASIEHVLKYYSGDSICFFQQPYKVNGETYVSFYLKPERCKKEKVDFPLFSEETDVYLWLYDRANDEDSPFISSMKRIAQYPELYEAVGPQNRELIDNILSSELQKKR